MIKTAEHHNDYFCLLWVCRCRSSIKNWHILGPCGIALDVTIFFHKLQDKKYLTLLIRDNTADAPRLCFSLARWPLVPNFCSWVTRKSLFVCFFNTNHMLANLDFTGSEHWGHYNFPQRVQPCALFRAKRKRKSVFKWLQLVKNKSLL